MPTPLSTCREEGGGRGASGANTALYLQGGGGREGGVWCQHRSLPAAHSGFLPQIPKCNAPACNSHPTAHPLVPLALHPAAPQLCQQRPQGGCRITDQRRSGKARVAL